MTPLITLGDFSKAVCRIAGRGTIREGPETVTVCVPAWKQRQIKEALEPCKPLGVRLVVRSLTLWQHLTLWDVRIFLVDVTVN